MSRILDLNRYDEPFVTVEELAEYWRVSDDTIRRDIAKGALIVLRVGPMRQIRIPIAEARRYGQPET